MSDLISRKKAIDVLYRVKVDEENCIDKYNVGYNDGIDSAVSILSVLPSAQPERKGKWERRYSRPNVYADLCWHCSVCEFKTSDNWANKWNFCPNCGADMRGDQNETD